MSFIEKGKEQEMILKVWSSKNVMCETEMILERSRRVIPKELLQWESTCSASVRIGSDAGTTGSPSTAGSNRPLLHPIIKQGASSMCHSMWPPKINKIPFSNSHIKKRKRKGCLSSIKIRTSRRTIT